MFGVAAIVASPSLSVKQRTLAQRVLTRVGNCWGTRRIGERGDAGKGRDRYSVLPKVMQTLSLCCFDACDVVTRRKGELPGGIPRYRIDKRWMSVLDFITTPATALAGVVFMCQLMSLDKMDSSYL